MNDITKKGNTLPMVADFEADKGKGMEGADKESFAVPFLFPLQGLSPQCETVEGAKPGLLINSITNELFSTVDIVPVAFQRKFNRWVPRDEGGGYRGFMTVAAVEAGRTDGSVREHPELNGVLVTEVEGEEVEVRDTRDHFVLFKDKNGAWQPAIMSMGSTAIKQSKRLMTLIQSIQLVGKDGGLFNPPSFSHVYRVKTEKETNEKGSWYTPVFSTVGPVEPDVYALAKNFYEKFTAGAVQTTPPAEERPASGF